MEKDIDMKLYNEYLNGQKDAFEILYNKYKEKIKYFVFNIVKDYQKAEDITQEVFIYIIQNKMQEKYSFKYYIFLIAKCRAYNYINMENRKKEINEQYFSKENNQIENDIIDIITENEKRKEILEAINMLDEKYKNAIYLVNIEELSYKETAQILGETVQNIKNLVHRGKKELRKILIKKGFDEMNKSLKVILIVILVGALLSGVVYAGTVIYNNYIKNNTNHNISMNPSYQSTLDEKTINNLWVGTIDLAWKELENQLGKERIDLEDGNLPIVNDLNSSTFTKDMLDENDYNVTVERTLTGGYKIDTSLNKELHFLEEFDNFSDNYNWTFGDSEEPIKYFGINNASSEEMNKNIEILFFNRNDDNSANSDDFAIKLKTQEGDEIILYRTNENKNFDEYYNDIQEKANTYTGSKEFLKEDELRIPYVRVNGMIAYNELYNKTIKDTSLYFSDVVQNINFYLNEKGCNLSSQTTLVTEVIGISNEPRYCYFDDQFIVFMKEANSNNPYFALKVDNTDILEKKEEIDAPKIIDYTAIDSSKYVATEGEYKFYEDENYEYYFPTRKVAYVIVYFKDGDYFDVENALKDGKITIDLLDKYEIEYIRREK